MFSLILADSHDAYYFNFQSYDGLESEWILNLYETLELLAPAFQNIDSSWFIANAKFDMGMLAREGVSLAGTIKDTEAGGRLVYNQHMKYGLGAAAERIGYQKSQVVEDYIKKHRLYTWLQAPSKKKKAKQPHYDQVPHNIIAPYGETDGEVVRALGMSQKEELKKLATHYHDDRFHRLCANEWQLTKTCFAMEQVGIKIDREYCVRAFAHETAIAEEAAREYKEMTGNDFVDSGKALANSFEALGLEYPKTEKGNPSFTEKVLSGFDSPLALIIKKHRKASKKAGTYYANFLWQADEDDLVHANIRQAGTDTARFSYSDPNLQNCSKEEGSTNPFLVRRAFVPRKNFCFVMIDYQAMEFRLLLEYAQQLDVIGKIKNEGLDVHAATAASMGVTRNEAKTLNFMLLYGGGAQKLADALKIPLERALILRNKYFKNLPAVKQFINNVITRAKSGYIFNWAGRRYYFDKDWTYKAPNHLIQGGCADVMRLGMNEVQEFLTPHRSRMLVSVHDEIVYEIHKDELDLVPSLKEIMENIFPYKHLQLTCDVDHSWISWGDKISGPPKLP